MDNLQERIEQLEKCVTLNCEGDPIGIGTRHYLWSNGLVKWTGITVVQFTVMDNNCASITGCDDEGGRHFARNHELFTTSDEYAAYVIMKRQEQS